MRIAMMAIRLFLKTPYYILRIWYYGITKKDSYQKAFRLIKKATIDANHAGRVTIEATGLENIPQEDGFMLYPNHQGMFDVLVFLESCPKAFSFIIKKEASKVILLKQVVKALGAYAMDREDIRQSMNIINQVSEEVQGGKNFLIFAEGTRSREGNHLGDFKGGSFKIATKAKCPIVPCALVDSFIPFDEKSLRPVTVKVQYLPPIYYEEYQNMKTTEIAVMVKTRIETAIKTIDK